jgi:hypothetical protein
MIEQLPQSSGQMLGFKLRYFDAKEIEAAWPWLAEPN